MAIGSSIIIALGLVLFFMYPVPSVPDSYVTRDSAIKQGDIAPNFTLNSYDGTTFALSEALKDGPVIVTFYRGNWCPICAQQLKLMESDLPKFKKLGAKLVAISAQVPAETVKTPLQFGLSFPILSDKGMKVTRLYGIEWAIPADKQEGFASWLGNSTGKSIADYQGKEEFILPIPATYVINREGYVVYAHVDENYKNRVNNNTLINVLKVIK